MKKNKEKELARTADVLEAYPEREQVASFPERRYIKMIRFLTIVSIVNLAFIISLACFYFYMSQNVDISIEKNGKVLFYSIDPEKKMMQPSGKEKEVVSALNIYMEKTIRDYLKTRYSYIYDRDKMTQRWEALPKESTSTEFNIPLFSSDDVTRRFSENRKQLSYNLFHNKMVQEARIYDLYLARWDLWSAYLEVFDFKLDDNLNHPCPCQDDSTKCWECKEQNKISKKRYKVWLRAKFFDEKDRDLESVYRNPLNVKIYAFYELPVRIPDDTKDQKETFWGLPPTLRGN